MEFAGVVINHVLYWFRRGGVAFVTKGPVEGEVVVGLTGSERFHFVDLTPQDASRLIDLLVLPGGYWSDPSGAGRGDGSGGGGGGPPRPIPMELGSGRLRG